MKSIEKNYFNHYSYKEISKSVLNSYKFKVH